MFKFSNITVLIFYFSILLFSCQLDDIEVEDWSPEIISPLINTTLTISDLIPEKGSTQYDDDGLIRLAVPWHKNVAPVPGRRPRSPYSSRRSVSWPH